MLIGSFHHSLQTKGRLAIPASFRPELGDNPILTRGLEPHLTLLPFNTWSELIKNLGTHPLVGPNDRSLRRLIAHSATQVDFDSQGRIHLPKLLRDWANLQSKVVIAGSVHWVEIWNPVTYATHLDTLNTKSQELAVPVNQSS